VNSKTGFTTGFDKTAGLLSGGAKLVGKGLAGAGKLVGKGLAGAGRLASTAAGGPISAALTAVGAASDYGDLSQKMRQAAQR